MNEYICKACGSRRYSRELIAFLECLECDALAYRNGYANNAPEILNEVNRSTLRNAPPIFPGDGRYYAVFGE